MKQGLNQLFPLLLGQCGDTLKSKLTNRSNSMTLKYEGSVLKLVGAIEEEVYGIQQNKYPPVLYHQACFKFFQHTQGKD